jgi:hypothetical protein
MSDVGFTIGGDNSAFLAAIKDSQAAVSQASAAIRASLQQMTPSFSKVTEEVEGIGEAAAGLKEELSTAFESAGIAALVEGFNQAREAIERIAQTARDISTNS